MRSHYEHDNSCPNCGRHCSLNDLQCSRGREYFGQEPKERTKKPQHENAGKADSIKDETVILMLKCGHALHHGLREEAENKDILFFLSQDEKRELTRLLKKCIEEWDN